MGRREPAFLTEVMDTIASFRDSKGSPPDKILDRLISQRKTPLKNASLQVKKALKTGLKTGLLKESGGKFKLGLGSKDYAIFKNFRQLEKAGNNLPVREVRRRRAKRRRSKRRRRGRRRSDYFDADLGLTTDKSKAFSLLKLPTNSSLPVREVRRRRKKARSKRRRGRRRGRRRSDILTIDGLDLENESDTEPMDRGRRKRGKRRRRRGSRRRGRRRALEDEGDPTSDDSKEVSGKSSEEKPKAGHGDNRTPAEKRDIVPDPPRGRLDNESTSDHCIHSYHHDTNHYGNPPHYGYE